MSPGGATNNGQQYGLGPRTRLGASITLTGGQSVPLRTKHYQVISRADYSQRMFSPLTGIQTGFSRNEASRAVEDFWMGMRSQ